MPFALQPFSQHTQSISLLTHWLLTKWQGDSYFNQKNCVGQMFIGQIILDPMKVSILCPTNILLAKWPLPKYFWPNVFGQMTASIHCPLNTVLAKCLSDKCFWPNDRIFYTKWQGYCCTHKTVYWPNAC